jgi:Asp-tRNA(Asn)/Glu-tRNA(Gln) amidotransferase B subunit
VTDDVACLPPDRDPVVQQQIARTFAEHAGLVARARAKMAHSRAPTELAALVNLVMRAIRGRAQPSALRDEVARHLRET